MSRRIRMVRNPATNVFRQYELARRRRAEELMRSTLPFSRSRIYNPKTLEELAYIQVMKGTDVDKKLRAESLFGYKYGNRMSRGEKMVQAGLEEIEKEKMKRRRREMDDDDKDDDVYSRKKLAYSSKRRSKKSKRKSRKSKKSKRRSRK